MARRYSIRLYMVFRMPLIELTVQPSTYAKSVKIPVSVSLVFAKARVSPLKTITIPRAALLAAHMLAKVLTYVVNLLHVPKDHLYAWTDSTIVLCWLSKSLKTFVSHRITAIKELLPGKYWRHDYPQMNSWQP